jgi:hypothetical protein
LAVLRVDLMDEWMAVELVEMMVGPMVDMKVEQMEV